jgi:hypothetical protein
MNRSRWIAQVIFQISLFLLVVGRVEIQAFDLKLGGKIENFFPVLLLATFLNCWGGGSPSRQVLISLRILWERFSVGLALIISGLLIGWGANLGYEASEQLLRFLLQIGTGCLLGLWLAQERSQYSLWIWIWLVALTVLQIRTPWGELSHPEMEGSFGHRNLQSAFYLLSFPILVLLIRVKQTKSGLIRMWCLVLFLSEIGFVLWSRSRSGLVGILAALGFWILYHYGKSLGDYLNLLLSQLGSCLPLNTNRQNATDTQYHPGVLIQNEGLSPQYHRFSRYALLGLVLLACLWIFPRFLLLGRELGNPYYLSRTGVWTAALEGLHNPQRWLVGTGMGEGYFWSIQESAMGNLNYRYRRGHHPHCLYLQWIYWGGITALMGWLFLVRSIHEIGKSKQENIFKTVLAACLMGYVILEFFETALKNTHLHALFWLDVTLLVSLLSAGQEEPDRKVVVSPGISNDPCRNQFLSIVLTFLPLLWAGLFGFPNLLALGLTLVSLVCLTRFPLPTPHHTEVFRILGILFYLQLLLPLIQWMDLSSWLLTGWVVTLGLVWYLQRNAIAAEWGRVSDQRIIPPAAVPLPSFPSFGALAFPLLVCLFVNFCFSISSLNIPTELKPYTGLGTLLGMALLWLSFWWWFPGCVLLCSWSLTDLTNLGFRRWLTLWLLLLGIFCFRMMTLGWALVMPPTVLEAWEQLLQKGNAIGCRSLEWSVQKQALASAVAQQDERLWIRWAKDANRDPRELSEAPSPLAAILAHGGYLTVPATEIIRGASAVGLAVTDQPLSVAVLYENGVLLRLLAGGQPEVHSYLPQSGACVHCCLDQAGQLLILESFGRVVRLDGTFTEVCPPPNQDRQPIFRRLDVDPQTGALWMLDLYGNLYHSDLTPRPPLQSGEGGSPWILDDRFRKVAIKDELAYDIARDIAITSDQKIALLDCYGQIWESSLAGQAVDGPHKKTHYWPSIPVGQSLQAVPGGYSLIDRYGGIYLSPFPMVVKGEDTLLKPGDYLFPLSLPRQEQDMIDHVFLPRERWSYLLTRAGKILTNHRWGKVWAE